MKARSMKSIMMLFLLSCTVIVTGGLLAGCGEDGAQGPIGPAGKDATIGVINSKQLTYDDLRNTALGGKILSIDVSGNQPVVTFQVYNKATMEAITGLRTFSLHIAQLQPEDNGSNAYWMNYITSSATATGAFRPTSDPVSSFNSSDGSMFRQGYSVVDNNDGTYAVTFWSNIKSSVTSTFPARTGVNYYKSGSVAYDSTRTHRVVVGVRGVDVPGVVGKTPGAYAGPINPVTGVAMASFTNTNGTNLVMDFIPYTGAVLSTPARDIVNSAACNKCHYRIEYGFPRGNNTSGHFGSRPDVRLCEICHTPQNDTTAAFTNADFTPFIHKIHMGEELPVAESWSPGTSSEIAFEVAYPQDIRKCDTCHAGTEGANWKTKPTRKACGSCHNNVNFVTGANHPASAGNEIQLNDAACIGCHSATKTAADHLTVALPDPNNRYTVTRLTGTTAGSNNNTNAAYVAAADAVPTGALVFSYDVKSVSTTSVGGAERPTIVFKLKSATSATATATNVVFDPASYNTGNGSHELMANFVGSPSVYFAWAVPQDGITAPVDFNATASGYIRNLWNGTAQTNIGSTSSPNFVSSGTITGPDGSGYYTAVLSYATVTSGAKMLTGGVGYTYALSTAAPGGTTVSTQPLTQINLAGYPYTPGTGAIGREGGEGGLIMPAKNIWKVATGYTARRTIVDNAKCDACHARIGVKPTYHAGQRNDAPTCSFCHNVNRVNSGWAANGKDAMHAIHAASKRVNKFSWEATAGAKFWTVGYPGVLKNCEQCHVAGMYDFSNSAYTDNNGALLDNMLFTTVATGTIDAAAKVIVTGNETITSSDIVVSPFVTIGANYGRGFSYNAGTGATTAPTGASLVISPISSACFACHDTAAARTHMEDNGGSIYAPRSTALTNKEACIVCHGPAANTAYGDYVPAIKPVHRWW